MGVSPIYFVFLKPSTLSSLFPYARDTEWGSVQCVYFGIIEIGDFDQHAVDVAGLLTGTAHVFYYGGKD
jgi:hypothetical protein